MALRNSVEVDSLMEATGDVIAVVIEAFASIDWLIGCSRMDLDVTYLAGAVDSMVAGCTFPGSLL